MTKERVLSRLGEHADEIRKRFGVKRLSVFGSIVRDAAAPGSDIDILVCFDGPATFDRFMDLKFYLEQLVGARVDLVTDRALRARLRPAIEQEAIDVA